RRLVRARCQQALRIGQRECGEGDLSRAVGRAVRRDADDLYGHGVRRLHRRGVADVEAAGLGGTPVDGYLAVGGGWAALDDAVRVEGRYVDPVAGEAGRPVAADGPTIGAEDLSITLDRR